MARILVTGAGSGLGLGAAHELHEHGHTVIGHVRDLTRADALRGTLEDDGLIVSGDLRDPDATRQVAADVDRLGGVDAIIHNAGTMEPNDALTVNVIAPYLLTALISAQRFVFISSSMHRGGSPVLDQLNRTRPDSSLTYSDSKLLVTALAFAIARPRPDILSNAVDPGWVPTRMGGPSAPDDLRLGHTTQVWLAEGSDPNATTAGYWFHQQQEQPHPTTRNEQFQDALVDALARRTGELLAL
jgi:NAD(P)-dependent dehydrogenase (short-subunit alcohol dehydrogenase family)